MDTKRGTKHFGGLFGWLLVCFLAQMLLEPLFEGSFLAGILADGAAYLLLAFAMLSMKDSFLLYPALVLFVLIMAEYTALALMPGSALLVAANFTTSAFLAIVVLRISLHVTRQTRIGSDAIMGGLCAYTLLGILWTYIYVNLTILNPGSFAFGPHGPHPDIDQTYALLYYYSFSTMLTVGYGDIIPLSHLAQSLSVIQALVGQFFMVFFMAVLVGMYTFGREKAE
ncbi:MAG: potassium channel family protein [Thermodesulfobacteriota bacterium]